MLISTFLLALALGQANAQPATGVGLYHICQASIRTTDNDKNSTKDVISADVCYIYLRAFVDGAKSADKNYVCMKGATFRTVARVYVAYMDKNPKLMDSPIRVGVAAAMKDAYACPAGN